MISVTEAKEIIDKNTIELSPVKCPLQLAAGKTLAEDVYAATHIPAYTQSSMDGYAFSRHHWKTGQLLTIKGEMAAGSAETFALVPGTATRIFTGAPLPTGADTVVMQEKTTVNNDQLLIADDSIVQGSNVRAAGSEIKAGELALEKDVLLSPAAIGFLAGIGIAEVLVYPHPSVSIIVTGNELQEPGQPLHHGQVYESNSYALQAAFKQLQIENVKVYKVADDPGKLKQVISDALLQSDVVLLTGGVSAGEYDFVAAAAQQNGIEQLFHKIKQRPGKPIYVGRKQHKLVFGLPGNPASVLTCFYMYVVPALSKLCRQDKSLRTMNVPLAAPFRKAATLTHFLKAFYDCKTVTLLDAQESYRMRSFAHANCLVQSDEGITEHKEGELVKIHLLPVQ